MGGGARCSRPHSPRSSKIVAAESPASDSAIAIDDLAMSATATRRDAVTADVVCRFRSGQRETKLLLHRARQKPAHAVLLPVCSLHHLFDAGPLGLAQEGEHPLLLGNALALWFVTFRRRLGGGRNGRDLAPGCRVRFDAPFLGRGALWVPGLRDGNGRHGFGLRWFAAPELTLARPKAPHIAGRALSASAAEQVNRPTPIAMRPSRQKSSRFLSRGALEASQSRGLVSRPTGREF